MDETRLETKLNELVKEFGEGIDPHHDKLTKLAEQAQANHAKLEKASTLCRNCWITYGCALSIRSSTLRRPDVKMSISEGCSKKATAKRKANLVIRFLCLRGGIYSTNTNSGTVPDLQILG